MKVLAEYWYGLKAQEQKLLMLAASIFVIFVFLVGIWRPLNQAIDHAQTELQKQQQLAQWMQINIAKIKAANPKAVVSSAGLSQLVNQTRSRYQINISKMQPKDNTLRVTIEQVEFNQLINWLAVLVEKYGVSVANLDVSQSENAGVVKVSRLVLVR